MSHPFICPNKVINGTKCSELKQWEHNEELFSTVQDRYFVSFIFSTLHHYLIQIYLMGDDLKWETEIKQIIMQLFLTGYEEFTFFSLVNYIKLFVDQATQFSSLKKYGGNLLHSQK